MTGAPRASWRSPARCPMTAPVQVQSSGSRRSSASACGTRWRPVPAARPGPARGVPRRCARPRAVDHRPGERAQDGGGEQQRRRRPGRAGGGCSPTAGPAAAPPPRRSHRSPGRRRAGDQVHRDAGRPPRAVVSSAPAPRTASARRSRRRQSSVAAERDERGRAPGRARRCSRRARCPAWCSSTAAADDRQPPQSRRAAPVVGPWAGRGAAPAPAARARTAAGSSQPAVAGAASRTAASGDRWRPAARPLGTTLTGQPAEAVVAEGQAERAVAWWCRPTHGRSPRGTSSTASGHQPAPTSRAAPHRRRAAPSRRRRAPGRPRGGRRPAPAARGTPAATWRGTPPEQRARGDRPAEAGVLDRADVVHAAATTSRVSSASGLS